MGWLVTSDWYIEFLSFEVLLLLMDQSTLLNFELEVPQIFPRGNGLDRSMCWSHCGRDGGTCEQPNFRVPHGGSVNPSPLGEGKGSNWDRP